MKNRILAIFGIGAYILSVLSSTANSEGTSVAPIALVVIALIAVLIFVIMATVCLWRIQKTAPILLISSGLILFVLSGVRTPITLTNILRIINFIAFFWTVLLLWRRPRDKGLAKNFLKDSGLTPDELSSVQEDLLKGNHKSAEQRIAAAQERQRREFEKATGVSLNNIIPEIGREISWLDIVNQVFRVIQFDRSGTTIDQNYQVKAKTRFKPYGYLLVESPILNQKVRLPIIHRDDFLLAASVFDEPAAQDLIVDHELLVTYAPKRLLPDGLSGSPHHVLHYVLTPSGTLDSYYSMDNDIHMAKPDPQKLFGPFVYEGEIRVQINPDPKVE